MIPGHLTIDHRQIGKAATLRPLLDKSSARKWSLSVLRVLRNKMRIMRKTAAFRALFPTVRGEVLATTLTQPDKWWYLSATWTCW